MLDAYSRHGTPEEASAVFDAMPAKDLVAYILNGYAHGGYLQEVKRVFHTMPETLNSMLVSYNKASGTGKAVFDRAPKPDDVTLLCIVVDLNKLASSQCSLTRD